MSEQHFQTTIAVSIQKKTGANWRHAGRDAVVRNYRPSTENASNTLFPLLPVQEAPLKPLMV